MQRREFIVGSMGAAFLSHAEGWGSDMRITGQTVTIGDHLLQFELTYGPRGLIETSFKSGPKLLSLTGLPWTVRIDGKDLTAEDSSVALIKSEGFLPILTKVVFEGSDRSLQWTLRYELTGPGRISKALSLTTAGRRTLQRVSLWNAFSNEPPVIARTKTQDIAAFYRDSDVGMFASLDFPYSQITIERGITKIFFPPFEDLQAGQTFATHSLTVGATKLSGSLRYGFDAGEVTAMDAYIQERYRPRFNRPMFVSASIRNLYTQVNDGIVFYTYKDQPTLNFNVDLLKREIDLMPKLGIEYYQVFPGNFDWGPNDPSPENVHSLMQYAREHGVRMGGYSATNRLFVAHFNEYRNRLDRPNWEMKDEKGKVHKDTFCFGNPEFVKYYSDAVVSHCTEFDSKIHCLDGLTLFPCCATNHGHPIGAESLYAQIKGLVRLIESIDNVSPGMMTWSNAGNWQDLLPKLAWSNHNLYLTDAFIDLPWQGLNMTRLLDDARREQMVSLHYKYFIPYRFYTNCQNFLCQNSVVPDIRNFEYGVLSTIAVTPNLCLSEERAWLDQLTSENQELAIAFYKQWTGFLAEQFDLWTKTYHVGENPGVGAVEIYSHASESHGFIFVVNPQYWNRTVEIPLDSSLGFVGSEKCEIHELYPTERLCLTAQGPFVSLSSKLPVNVPAQSVLVLEVKPAPKRIEFPRLYGLTGSLNSSPNGYQISTRGEQGRSERFAVLLPPDSPRVAGVAVRSDIPKQPKRLWEPTPINLLVSNEQGALMEVKFRRRAAPSELRQWQVRPGELDSGVKAGWHTNVPGVKQLNFPLFVDVEQDHWDLPLSDEFADSLGFGPLANFCGAYIENAFSEIQETWIDLRTGKAPGLEGSLMGRVEMPARLPLDALAKDSQKGWWLQSSFYLPFIFNGGTEPAADEHTWLVLPLIRMHLVQGMSAWINKVPLLVENYRYPRNPKLSCYYADLLNSGTRGGQDNKLVLHLQC